jgi:uncharacterized protein with von Willebrand factor type A (vWA) domain
MRTTADRLPKRDAVSTLVDLGRRLRESGLPVGTGRILTFCCAVGAFGFLDRDTVYWAGRVSLVARPEDFERYDLVFGEWLRSHFSGGQNGAIEMSLSSIDATGASGLRDVRDADAPSGWTDQRDVDAAAAPAKSSFRPAASAVEALRAKSFGDLTEEERRRVSRMIRDLAVLTPVRASRRTRPAARGTSFDLRRTLRRSLRTSGEPFERSWRTRKVRRRPIVLLVDISGSMAPYSRALLQFAYAAMKTGRRIEVFCFGTRLTRVTPLLRTHDPSRAFSEVGRRVADWDGGTRIGDSLKSLLDGWSQRSALRGAIMVVCSDGLERGDPDALRLQMARLRRIAHRIVWANPLKGSPRYEPLARGMAAALPSVDVFLSGHDVQSLEKLADAIAISRPA